MTQLEFSNRLFLQIVRIDIKDYHYGNDAVLIQQKQNSDVYISSTGHELEFEKNDKYLCGTNQIFYKDAKDGIAKVECVVTNDSFSPVYVEINGKTDLQILVEGFLKMCKQAKDFELWINEPEKAKKQEIDFNEIPIDMVIKKNLAMQI